MKPVDKAPAAIVVLKGSDQEFEELLRGAVSDPDCRVIVIDFSGPRKSDIDLPAMLEFVSGSRVPVLLAITGVIADKMFDVVAACHICFADPGTSLSDPSRDRPLTARTAMRAGIVNGVVEDPFGSVLSIAGVIQKRAPLAVRACLKLIDNSGDDFEAGLANELKLFADLFESKDMRRGTRGFIDKKKVLFEGN